MPILPFRSPSRDVPGAFLERLIAHALAGAPLADPSDPEVLRRWLAITEGIPDAPLPRLLPQTLQHMFRDPNLASALDRCGIAHDRPAQHVAIASYLVTCRHHAARRSVPDGDPIALLAALRLRVRALGQQFGAALADVALGEQGLPAADAGRPGGSQQEEALAQRLRNEREERRLAALRQREFRLYRLQLFLLRERLHHQEELVGADPLPLPVIEMAVQAKAASLDALGLRGDAETAAREILGEPLTQAYFGDPLPDHAPPGRDATALAHGLT